MRKSHRSLFLKSIATVLVFTILFSQTAWAIDVRQMLADAYATFDEEDALRPHGMAASDLQAGQQAQQAAVNQQQAMQDLENLNFSLTTQNGDVLKYIDEKLDSIERPDGTTLKNIVTDAQGNIVEADLKLADGSIQVFQNGQVLGYQTPDGTQIIYENGRVKKTISKSGEETLYSYVLNGSAVTETTLDSPSRTTKYDANGKIKESTRKSDNQKTIYLNGIIQKIVNGDGTQIQFTSQIVSGDTVVTPQGGTATEYYTDAQGNKFYFVSGNVSKIILADGSTVDGITWDSANKIDGATLTQTDGSKFIYQAKQLTRSYDPAGVVTNYTYTATSITASKSGNTWEYLLDGTPTRSTTLAGDIATYLQTGTYKGFKATEIIGGVTYTYTYQGSGAAITAQRTGPGGSTVLPVTTLQTAFRSSRNATESWLQDNAEGSLYTWYNNLYVTYNINLPAAGDLKIEFDSTNFGANIPSNFSFQLEISVDNVVKTQYYTPQGPGWKTNSLTLTGLTLGAHTIKINWVNQYYATGYDSNFKFKNLKLSQSSASTAQTVTTGYQSTPLTPRVDTVKKSLITKPAATTVPSSADFTSITYDPNAKLKQVIFKDGSKLIFDQGILKQALDPAGKQTSFNFEQSALSTIIGSTITQSNLTSTYSATGKLSSIKTGDVTVHYKEDGSAVDWIEKTDGTEMWNLAFDSSGALRDAIIYTPDGEERTYQAGKLVGLRRPDQTQLIYASDKLVQMVTPEKLTYTFTYTASKIEAAIQSTVIPDALTPIKMEYDLQFNLKKVTRQNQEILNYLNTDLVQIDAPGNTAKIFAYQKDSAGKILSYTVTQGNVVTSYDAANNPVSAVISPTSDNPNTFNVTYTYGRIRSVKKNNVVVFNYTYSFDSDGNEVTVIDDLETNTVKTYSGGNMLYALDKNTQVQTNYTYSSNKVSRVNVSRFGRILNEYAYAYSGADTIVTDSQNVIRTYGSDQKLKFLERDGEKYQYTYSQTTAASGPAVSQTAVLPVSTLNTTSRETNSYGGKWVDNPTEQSLATDSPYLALTYTFDLSQAGDLKLDFDSTNWGANIPSNFSFQFDYAIDGVWKWNNRTLSSPGPGWKSNQTVFAGLSAGQHTITIKWTNDYWVANQYDANLKIKNLKLTHTFQAPAQTPKDITEESLVEKRLSDGTIIRYSAAKVDRIDYANGKIFKNLVRNEKGELTGATLFQSAADTLGTKYQFADGEISKVTLPTGQDLIYSYDRDVTGNITTTWVKKGAAKLQYDAQGNLKSLRIDGVLTPEEIQQSVTHTYVGGVGSLSIDGNYNTAQSVLAGCSGCGGSGATAVSEHALSFVQPQTLTDLQFRMAVSAWAHGNYTRNYNATYYVEVQKNGVWQTVPGTTYFASGGDGDVSQDSKTVILAGLNLDGVTALRAFANGFGNASGGEGNSGGSASIYEIQYKLADLANLSFSLNSSSQTERYALTGYRGSVKFDTQGKITQANSSYSGISQELANVVQNYTSVPNLSSELNTMYAAMADGDTVVLQEYSADGTLETQTRADGTVTLYANNKPAKMLSATGETLIEYSYDAAGNPTRVFLKNTRSELPELVAAARLEIEKKRSEALRGLVAQKNLAYQSILDQANQNRQSLESARGILEGQLKQISSISAKGKEAKSQKADAISQINGSLDQIIGQFTTLYSQEADAYAALDAQVKTVSDQIEVDSQKAVTDLGTQETNFKKEILRQEVSPIVYDVYRRILGRDPDTNEYNSWINQIDYNSGAGIAEVKTTAGINLTQALNTAVNALPELAQRQAYVNTIKSSVTSEVNAYLAMTQTQKEAYAASLGLTSADLIPLSSADGAKILAWINSRSLHFGQSAFLALESLLDQKGKTYTRTTLAKQAILVDILSGVISPLDDGDLILSVFALNKTAKLYGVDMLGVNATWDGLRTLIPSTATASSPRVIAHINGNHFVIVTAMNADTISFIDPGKGKDKQNEVMTLSKGDFLKVWKGDIALTAEDQARILMGVTTQSLQVSPLVERAAYIAKNSPRILSSAETQSIRGAFLPILVAAIVGAIQTIGAFVGAIISAIGAVASTIGSFIAGGLQTIGIGLAKFGEGLAYLSKGLYGGIKFAASTVGKFFANPFASAAAQNAPATFTIQNFGNVLFQNALRSSLGVLLSRGLEGLGLPPQATAVISSAVSGGALGGMQAGGFSLGKAFGGALTGALMAGGQVLMQNAGMSGALSQTLSLITAPLIGGIQSGNIGGTLTQLVKELPTLGAYYGVQKAGEALGLDPRLTALAAVPAAGLVNGISKTIFTGTSQTPKPDIKIDPERPSWAIPVSQAAWQSYVTFIENTMPFAMMAANNSYYLSKTQTTSQIGTSVTTITSTPGLPAGAQTVQYQDPVTGQNKVAYKVGSDQNYTIYDAYTDEALKRVSPDLIEEGKFVYQIDLNENGDIRLEIGDPAYLANGKISYKTLDNKNVTFGISDKNVREIRIDGPSTDVVLSPGATKDAAGKMLNGIVNILSLGLSFTALNGNIKNTENGQISSSKDLTKRLTTAYIFGNGFENNYRPENTPDPLMQSYVDTLRVKDNLTNSLREFVVYLYEKTKTLGNAVDWLTDFQLTDDEKNFLTFATGSFQALVNLMLNPTSSIPIPARFQEQFSFWKSWYSANVLGLGNDLVQETINELEALQNGTAATVAKGPIQNGVAFAHSGFTAPLLNAIEQMDYDVENVIIYEGPYPDYSRYFTNTHLQRIIHVQGTGSPLDGDAWVPFLGDAKFDGANPAFENLNIKIIGAFHNDFSYDEAAWNAKIAAVAGSTQAMVDAQQKILQAQKERNREVNAFMRRLYRAVLEDQAAPGSLKFFLSNTIGITYASAINLATIDLNTLEM